MMLLAGSVSVRLCVGVYTCIFNVVAYTIPESHFQRMSDMCLRENCTNCVALLTSRILNLRLHRHILNSIKAAILLTNFVSLNLATLPPSLPPSLTHFLLLSLTSVPPSLRLTSSAAESQEVCGCELGGGDAEAGGRAARDLGERGEGE